MANAAAEVVAASEKRTADSFALGPEANAARLAAPVDAAGAMGRLARTSTAVELMAKASAGDDGEDSGDSAASGVSKGTVRLATSYRRAPHAGRGAGVRTVKDLRRAAGIGREGGEPVHGESTPRGYETPESTREEPQAAAPPRARTRPAGARAVGGTPRPLRRERHTTEARSPLAMRQSRMNQEAARARAAGRTGAQTEGQKASVLPFGRRGPAKRTVWSAAKKSAGHGAGGFAAAGAGAAILPLLMAVLLSITVVAAISGSAARRKATVPVGGNEAYIARYLMTVKGLDDVHAAAILGNIQQESGFDPAACQGGDADGAADPGSGVGFGICQWSTAGHKAGLRAVAAEMGLDWSDIAVQCEYLGRQIDAWDYADSYTVNANSTDPPYPAEVSGSRSGFDAATDVDEATRQACYGWTNFAPGTPAISRRIGFARAALDAIRSGKLSGNTAVTDAALLAASWGTTYVYGGTDIRNGCDCSYFTLWCYARAGVTLPHQSEAQRNAGTVIPISEAQPGDLLWMPGHVGIYLGPDSWAEQTPPRIRVVTGRDPAAYWTSAVRF